MRELRGVILCGGESRRMGNDKGLLKTMEGHWATNMGDKLLAFRIPVCYSIHERQWNAYSTILPPDRLIIDSRSFPDIQGPLKGLLSVHEKFASSDLFLLACDMQDMDTYTIRHLLEAYWREKHRTEKNKAEQDHSEKDTSQQKEVYQFFAYEEGEFLQPFCAIYTSEELAAAGRLVEAVDPPDRLSLQTLLRTGKTLRLPLTHPAAFTNYNSRL